MIKFKQKEYTEYDAMKTLYTEWMKRARGDRRLMPNTISPSSLIPILKGNNIVIERFVISTSFWGKDKYRMYLKIGAKAKLPDDVRLPSHYYPQRIGNLSMKFKSANLLYGQKNNSIIEKSFAKDNKGGDGGGPSITSEFTPDIRFERMVQELSGEVVKYDKRERSLVLEFKDIHNALNSLEVLPFGLNYSIYLLDA